MYVEMNEIKTKTYSLIKGWYLDIVTNCKYYEAWIYHRDFGTKELMFEVPKKQQSYDEFLDIVEANYPEYQVSYTKNIMEGGLDD